MAARFVRLTAALAVLATLVVATGCQRSTGPRFETVTIKGEAFRLEVAADDVSRTRGLMERESIPDQGGMLFIFPDVQPRAFWMGYCLTDMDIIFLDARGFVTATHTMTVEPPRRPDESELDYRARMADYVSGAPAQFAIELQAGEIERLGVKFQDKIELDLDRLKRMAQ